jgi:hypothetical protein
MRRYLSLSDTFFVRVNPVFYSGSAFRCSKIPIKSLEGTIPYRTIRLFTLNLPVHVKANDESLSQLRDTHSAVKICNLSSVSGI